MGITRDARRHEPLFHQRRTIGSNRDSLDSMKYRTGFGHRIADWRKSRHEPQGRPMKRYNEHADESFSTFLEKQQRRVASLLRDKPETTRSETWHLTTRTHKAERRRLEMPPPSVGESLKAPRW